MTDTISTTTPYDYRQYDRIWQRVDPTLNPYPTVRDPEPMDTQPTAALSPRMEPLPGAQSDPCCMGSAALELLQVLEGFIQVELEDRWYYLGLLRCAPSAARGLLRDFATQKAAHAKRLSAVYYLITGNCYQHNGICGQRSDQDWCHVLRNRYHVEACNGFNYARATDETTDPCLRQLLQELSTASYHMAQRLLLALEKQL